MTLYYRKVFSKHLESSFQGHVLYILEISTIYALDLSLKFTSLSHLNPDKMKLFLRS